MNQLTADRLRQVFDYNPDTGEFIRKIQTSNRAKMGQPSGTVNGQGYVIIRLDGVQYLGHRLAWLYMTGEMPTALIDHRNEDRTDNRWSNLRQADNAQNLWNRGASSRNKSGYKGVSYDRRTGRWRASIKARDAHRFLGRFATPEQAHAAYVAAASELHQQFANPGRSE
jgi:hypothetical protein